MQKIICIGIFHFVFFLSQAQTKDARLSDIITRLEQITDTTITIRFENNLTIRNQGGHIQGIQRIVSGDGEYFFLSGSSDQQAYYAVVKTGNKNMVISHNILLEKPFKHAGGFQIFDNLLAIGVEDNDAKKASKVFIFQVENPERLPEKPLGIIDRMGTRKRATAGCVAITGIDGKILIVVGDWDTVNLDFYLIDRDLLGLDPNALVLEYSLDTRKADKSGWIDDEWLSYQNINFIHNEANQLFLAGMTSNADGTDILDLYQISTVELETFTLRKVYSKSFGSNSETRFRWGAGVYISPECKIQVMAAPENIGDQSVIHIYE